MNPPQDTPTPRTDAAKAPTEVTIRWDDCSCAYYVNVPNWDGGTMVTKEHHEACLAAQAAQIALLREALLQFAEPGGTSLASQALAFTPSSAAAEMGELRKDKARVDACLRHINGLGVVWADGKSVPVMCKRRESIDYAIQQEAKS